MARKGDAAFGPHHRLKAMQVIHESRHRKGRERLNEPVIHSMHAPDDRPRQILRSRTFISVTEARVTPRWGGGYESKAGAGQRRTRKQVDAL